MKPEVKHIINNQATMHYQAIVHSHSNTISHYEALLRIQNNDRVHPPKYFLSLLDTDKERKELLLFTAKEVIKTLSNKNNNIPIALNLTYHDLEAEYISPFLELLEKNSETINNKLIIEIVETIKPKNIDKVQEICDKFHQLGIKLALDDFGIEYSNLFVLSNINFSYLKIDGFFVKNIQNKKTFEIVKTIVKLCNSLKIEIIAEQIEDAVTAKTLKTLGIDFFQGYFFSLPSPITEMTKITQTLI